jgi:hypothetical protein
VQHVGEQFKGPGFFMKPGGWLLDGRFIPKPMLLEDGLAGDFGVATFLSVSVHGGGSLGGSLEYPSVGLRAVVAWDFLVRPEKISSQLWWCPVFTGAYTIAGEGDAEQSGDGCGSRLGPAKPPGIVGSSTWPAVSQGGGDYGAKNSTIMALFSEVPACTVISLDKHVQDAGTHVVKVACSVGALLGRKGCGTPATPPDPERSGEQGVAGTQLQHTPPCAVHPRRSGRGHAQGSLPPRAAEVRTQTARSGKGEAPGLLKAGFAASGQPLELGELEAESEHEQEFCGNEPSGGSKVLAILPVAARGGEQLDVCVEAEILLCLEQFRDQLYSSGYAALSKKARRRHRAHTRPLLRGLESGALSPEAAAVLAEIQLCIG